MEALLLLPTLSYKKPTRVGHPQEAVQLLEYGQRAMGLLLDQTLHMRIPQITAQTMRMLIVHTGTTSMAPMSSVVQYTHTSLQSWLLEHTNNLELTTASRVF